MATHSSVLAWRIPGMGGAWWAAVYGVAQSRTRLKRLSSSSSSKVSFCQDNRLHSNKRMKILKLDYLLISFILYQTNFASFKPPASAAWPQISVFLASPILLAPPAPAAEGLGPTLSVCLLHHTQHSWD